VKRFGSLFSKGEFTIYITLSYRKKAFNEKKFLLTGGIIPSPFN
jgi:hypothetical protein